MKMRILLKIINENYKRRLQNSSNNYRLKLILKCHLRINKFKV